MIALSRTRCALLASSLLALPSAAYAGADVKTSADVSAHVGYANNPFNLASTDTASGYGEIQVRPRVAIIYPTSQFVVSGEGDYKRYFRRYGDSTTYGAGLDYSGTPSASLKTHLYGSFRSAIVGQDSTTIGVFDPTQPVPTLPSGTDITLFGSRDRVNALKTGGDLGLQLSARDSVSASAHYDLTRYKQRGALSDYDNYGGALAYSRQVSQRLQVGITGTAAQYKYQIPGRDSTVFTTQFSFQRALTAEWKLDGQAGLTFVQRSIGANTHAFAGSLNICRISVRTNFCLNAHQATVPTGGSGTQNEISVGGNYSYKLSERGTILASANYVRNGTDPTLGLGNREYLRGSLGYDQVMTQRISINVTSRYAKTYGTLLPTPADYGALLGVTARLGRSQ